LAGTAATSIAASVNCAKFDSTSFSLLPELINSIATVDVSTVRETVVCVRPSGAVTKRRLYVGARLALAGMLGGGSDHLPSVAYELLSVL